MISFIVIGRNEGWKLTKCFESIYRTIEINKLSKYEIIYVDSNSTDDSIARAKYFRDVKIFKITGKFNSAVARNIGAKESSGQTLYFIDGDMEIIPDFLPLVYNEEKGLIYDFVSGQYKNKYYDNAGNFLFEEDYDKSLKIGDKYQAVTGGLFIISKILWDSVGGMRTKYRRSQDIDLGLRLAKNGILLLRKKELMAIHHTKHRKEKGKMWKMLLDGSFLFNKSVLYRDHFMNKNIYTVVFRNDYTLVVLISNLIFWIFTGNFLILLVYLMLSLLRSLYYVKERGIFSLISSFFFILARDSIVLIGFFLFHPISEKKHEYVLV